MKRFCIAIVSLLIAAPFVSDGSAHAAKNAWTASSTSYSKTWTFVPSVGSTVNVCARLTATGTLTYESKWMEAYNYAWTGNIHGEIRNGRISNPALSVKTYAINANRTCSTTLKNAGGVELQQTWSGNGCNWNPSFSVSVPWGASVSAWPTCGSKNIALRSTNTGTSVNSSYAQSNSGAPITVPNPRMATSTSVSGLNAIRDCWAITATLTVWNQAHTHSDTMINGGGNANSVCATITG